MVARRLLVILLLAGGCAGTDDADRRHDGSCLYSIGRPRAVGGEYQLIKGGLRVRDDDLIVATADVPEANGLAARSQLEGWIGIGSLVLGPILFAPGVGLFAYGLAKDQDGSVAGGVILGLTGLAGIVAGAVMVVRSEHHRVAAIDAYNAARGTACRP